MTTLPHTERRLAVTFYRFVELPDAAAFAAALRVRCETLAIRGTVILASEGINGTVAGSVPALQALLQWLRADARLHNLGYTALPCDIAPFQRLKVRVKPEIVTFRQGMVPTEALAGIRLAPLQWNALLESVPRLVAIDTRNAFEVAAGSFMGAVDPGISAFSDLPGWIETQRGTSGLLADKPPVAMFCTGGIRCEKSTAHLRAQGFDAVYQLQGGILRYLAEVPLAASRWRGDCFVFDERISVAHGVRAEPIEQTAPDNSPPDAGPSVTSGNRGNA